MRPTSQADGVAFGSCSGEGAGGDFHGGTRFCRQSLLFLR